MLEERESAVTVELVLDSYRVVGDLMSPGGPRRLVDILNAIDAAFVLVRNATIDDPLDDDDEPRQMDIVQVHLNTILFAIPHGADVMQRDPLEAVRKVPVMSTIAMPGFEVTGNLYLLPEAQPAQAQILGTRHFVPMTKCKVRSAFSRTRRWEEEIVVVNLARAVLFAPMTAAAVAASA